MEADEPPVADLSHDHHGTDCRLKKEETGWSKNTVITMLSRLEGKEAVRHEEGRRAKLYFPAVDREDAIEAETETFLDKIGGLGLLMSAMVEKNALTENDIAELSAILEKAGGKL